MDNYLDNYYGKWIKPRLKELEFRKMGEDDIKEFYKWKAIQTQKNNIPVYYNGEEEEWKA